MTPSSRTRATSISCPGSRTSGSTVTDSIHGSSTILKTGFVNVGQYQLVVLTSGGGVGDLQINPIPPIGAPTMTTGYTLITFAPAATARHRPGVRNHPGRVHLADHQHSGAAREPAALRRRAGLLPGFPSPCRRRRCLRSRARRSTSSRWASRLPGRSPSSATSLARRSEPSVEDRLRRRPIVAGARRGLRVAARSAGREPVHAPKSTMHRHVVARCDRLGSCSHADPPFLSIRLVVAGGSLRSEPAAAVQLAGVPPGIRAGGVGGSAAEMGANVPRSPSAREQHIQRVCRCPWSLHPKASPRHLRRYLTGHVWMPGMTQANPSTSPKWRS